MAWSCLYVADLKKNAPFNIFKYKKRLEKEARYSFILFAVCFLVILLFLLSQNSGDACGVHPVPCFLT